MPTVLTVVQYCAECTQERSFVQPECLDEHANDCPEWMCLDCGAAVLRVVTHDVPALRPLPRPLLRSA